MFGSEFENIKEYKPIEPESEIREIEKIKDNSLENLIKTKEKKPKLKQKDEELKNKEEKEDIKEMKKSKDKGKINRRNNSNRN